MKKLCILLFLIVSFINENIAQVNITPDKNTLYYNEAGVKITEAEFKEQVKGGAYTGEPSVKAGKLVSIKLRKASGDEEGGNIKLSPDENTLYYDEDGSAIDQMTFMMKAQEGGYGFEPDVADGKLVSLKLKKSGVSLATGDAAPDFTVTDIKGKSWSLNDLKGKTVVINFWFTTCAPCIEEMPHFNALVDSYKANNNVVFLAVTYDPKEKVEKLLDKKEFKFNVVASQQKMIDDYGVIAYPTTFIIDKNGKIALQVAAYSEGNVAKVESTLMESLK